MIRRMENRKNKVMSGGNKDHANQNMSSLRENSSANGKKSAKSAIMVPEDTRHNGAVMTSQTNPPLGFLPFSHNVITPEMAEQAAKNINETDETREKGLREMRQILRSDPDLQFTDEDDFLLLFLRSKKFDPKKASNLFKLALDYVESYRYMLEEKDPITIRRVINANMVGFLPYRDRNGRAVVYARADAWNPDTICVTDAIFGYSIGLQSAGFNPVNQVTGFIVVLDLKGLKMQQVFAISKWLIVGTVIIQRVCPCYIKTFHVVNIPYIYKIGWKIVSPLLQEKIRKRFVFHKSSDLSSLYEYVPKEILPTELGGPISFSNEHWAWDIDNIEKEYYNMLNRNYYKSKRKKAATL